MLEEVTQVPPPAPAAPGHACWRARAPASLILPFTHCCPFLPFFALDINSLGEGAAHHDADGLEAGRKGGKAKVGGYGTAAHARCDTSRACCARVHAGMR